MVSSVQQKSIDAELAPARIGSEISASIAKKSQDVQKLQGAAILQLLDSAAQSAPGRGDPLVAKATGKGSLLDVTA